MGRSPTNSHSSQFKYSRSNNQIENPSFSVSESLSDLRLPQELITEILLLLPVKSLLKFKCVSKPWLSLISSPQFIKSHFSRSSKEEEYLNHQLLFTTHKQAGMKRCSLYSALYEADPSAHVSDIEYPNPHYPPKIVGIVNGLICLAIETNHILISYILIWNPALRKSKLLPRSTTTLESQSGFVNYGFGYDGSTDDYKVVSLLHVDFFELEVKVYSLRTDSWRRIEVGKIFVPMFDCPGMYANGRIYWSAFIPDASTPSRWLIVSLDMVREKFVKVQQPDYEPGDYVLKLEALGERERLSVLCYYYGTKKADLWVMDKRGVEESWCKVVSIRNNDVHHLSCYSVLCSLSNGEIVLASGHGLLVYHSKHKQFRKIVLEFRCASYVNVATYVESLVWPYA